MTMKPDWVDQSCTFEFGIEPSRIEEDEGNKCVGIGCVELYSLLLQSSLLLFLLIILTY